jgi:uncharacterized protein (TIGR02172 family)
MKLAQLGYSIAKGNTAEIYKWRRGEVLKLFYKNRSEQEARYEATIAKAVQETGLAPRVSEVVQVGNRWGVIYEKIEGTSLAESLQNNPSEMLQFTKQFAELHARIHAVSNAAGLPLQLERLKKKIQSAPLLTATLRQKVLAHLETLLTAQALCHGDFHPDNVLIKDNRFFVIDWMDATLGHPLADVTRTLIILEGTQMTEPSLFQAIQYFKTAYLENYFAVSSFSRDDLEPWRPVIAAARLTEGQQEAWLLEQVKLGMAQLS